LHVGRSLPGLARRRPAPPICHRSFGHRWISTGDAVSICSSCPVAIGARFYAITRRHLCHIPSRERSAGTCWRTDIVRQYEEQAGSDPICSDTRTACCETGSRNVDPVHDETPPEVTRVGPQHHSAPAPAASADWAVCTGAPSRCSIFYSACCRYCLKTG
jgi:hypothetical protein